MIGLVLSLRRSAPRRRRARGADSPRPRRTGGRLSASHFDSIATVYDESLPAPRGRALPAQAGRVCGRHCPARAGARRRLRHRRAGRAARRGRATEVVGVDPSEGMLEVLRRARPAVEAVQASGDRAPVRRRQLRAGALRGGHAPHRRPRGRAADAGRDGQGRPTVGPRAGLGPQPPQPVLGAADGSRAPGHRRASG